MTHRVLSRARDKLQSIAIAPAACTANALRLEGNPGAVSEQDSTGVESYTVSGLSWLQSISLREGRRTEIERHTDQRSPQQPRSSVSQGTTR